MAVSKAEVMLAGSNLFLGSEIASINTNFDKENANPFLGKDLDASEIAENSNPSKVFGNPKSKNGIINIVKNNEIKPKLNQAFTALSNYIKNINSRVTDYDIAVKTVNRYLPSQGELISIIESNPRIMSILEKEGLV